MAVHALRITDVISLLETARGVVSTIGRGGTAYLRQERYFSTLEGNWHHEQSLALRLSLPRRIARD
jgi:hypothetical protein